MVLAILQARMSSTRLPGKVLQTVHGAPMLARQVERVRRAHHLSQLVVATSTRQDDDPLWEFCQGAKIACYRGDLDDVLGRFLGCIEAFGPEETFVRLTGDCPLADPALIDQAILSHRDSAADYTYVQETWSFPKGLDVEVCQTDVLKNASLEAVGPDREHVTSFIYARPQRYRINAINRDPPLRFRWTVDTAQDLEFVRSVYDDLYPHDPAFTTEDVLAWQATHPDRVLPNLVQTRASS